MKVFKVPDDLAEKYSGAGHALAASRDDRLVDIIYIGDILPDFDEETDLADVINDERIGPHVKWLQAQGNVHIGMLSCGEFVEL